MDVDLEDVVCCLNGWRREEESELKKRFKWVLFLQQQILLCLDSIYV
jgi:hypothetical protein